MYPLQENPQGKESLKHLWHSSPSPALGSCVSGKVKDGAQQVVNFSQCFSADPGAGFDSHLPQCQISLYKDDAGITHSTTRLYPPGASFNVLQWFF